MFDASSGCSRLDADVQRIVFVELARLLLDFNAATGSPPCKHPTVAPWQKQCRWKIGIHGAAEPCANQIRHTNVSPECLQSSGMLHMPELTVPTLIGTNTHTNLLDAQRNIQDSYLSIIKMTMYR